MVSTPSRGGCRANVVRWSPLRAAVRADRAVGPDTRDNSLAVTCASMSGADPRYRPCCSATRARSSNEAPHPPDASSTAICSAPFSPSRRQRSGSCPDGSAARTRSGGDSLAYSAPKASISSCCSSEGLRSIRPAPSSPPRHSDHQAPETTGTMYFGTAWLRSQRDLTIWSALEGTTLPVKLPGRVHPNQNEDIGNG